MILADNDLPPLLSHRFIVPVNRQGDPMVTITAEKECGIGFGPLVLLYSNPISLQAAQAMQDSQYFRKCHNLIQSDIEMKYRESRKIKKFLEQVSKIKF